MNSVIEIKDLTKLYKNGRGIKNVSFSVNKGDIVGLLGPNGSGKTTVMKAILGLNRPSAGIIRLFGKDADEHFEEVMRKVGGLVEAPALYKDLSAEANLKIAARLYDGVDNERIINVLELVHLSQYKNDKAGKFSLGMKQRLGLALALLAKPQLLILDEPVNGLDIEGVVEIREIILKLSSLYGTTFLISSHLASEIEKTCSKVAVMHEGELISFDTTEDALRLNPSMEEYFLSVVRNKRGELLL